MKKKASARATAKKKPKNFTKVVYRKRHIVVMDNGDYYTIVNTITNTHGHVKNLKSAMMVANHAVSCDIPDDFSPFLREAVLRVI